MCPLQDQNWDVSIILEISWFLKQKIFDFCWLTISFPLRAFLLLSDLKSYEDKDCLEIVKICDISFYPTNHGDDKPNTPEIWNPELAFRLCISRMRIAKPL